MDFEIVDSALSSVQSYGANSNMASVSLKMLGNSMEQTQEMGDAMMKMMEHSVTPHVGGNIDVSV